MAIASSLLQAMKKCSQACPIKIKIEKVMNIFCKWHFHNASKEVFWQTFFLNFMHGFKSAIL
jgi:hypothetical protein